MKKIDINFQDIHSEAKTIIVPSFVEFLQHIIAKQKLELKEIQEMDVKALIERSLSV